MNCKSNTLIRTVVQALLFALCVSLSLGCSAQAGQSKPGANGNAVPVAVGKGSYASLPPANAPDSLRQTNAKSLYVLDRGDRAIPTNQWWTNLIIEKYAGQLWAFPQMVTADKQGINIFFPIKWNAEGRDPVSDLPLAIRGEGFQPADARARTWGDWTVLFREAESPTKYLDVTLGRGLPYVWVECHGVAPQIVCSGEAACFDQTGKNVSFPTTADHLGIECGGRSFGVFAPAGTRFTKTGNQISCQFMGAKQFLVISPLPKREDLAVFHRYAYGIPRGSMMTWKYDPDAAQVTTTWHLETELLQGSEKRLIQGWLPHHYRATKNDLQLNGMQYLTPRGTMKCAVGNDFHLTYPFNGFLPMLPAPSANPIGGFNAARMKDYLTRYATRTEYGEDTYWGGKHLTQFAQYMTMARELKDPAYAKLRDSLHTALVDWYTYTPGEKAHYFTRYPNWRALVGVQPSYGSEGFNDHHFHYGYFTTASALLGMEDPQFLKDYGGMARLVAKEYANWDRSDANFPFLRTFDIWEGHSWASGFSSPTGDNQESSSEAMQSWGGLFLLGSALGDPEMTAAGAMGYAMESQAVMEYWFNQHGDNFSPNYKHPIAGMVWSGGLLYGTYFSGEPAWIYGIQWLPVSPMLSYLARDPEFAKKSFQTMMSEQEKNKGTNSISKMGPALGSVILGYALQFDPDYVCTEMDTLYRSGDPVARDNDTPGLTYYIAHANRDLGAIQWDYHTSLPTSTVYYNKQTKTWSYVVYNPQSTPQTVTVYKLDKKIGTLRVPAHSMVVKNAL